MSYLMLGIKSFIILLFSFYFSLFSVLNFTCSLALNQKKAAKDRVFKN